MSTESSYFPKVTRVHLQLAQYPILADIIRKRMREEIFRRGVISRERFEAEAREKAVQSQQREGIIHPYEEEPVDVWERRLRITRDNLTDFYFAYNIAHERFEEILREVLMQRASPVDVLTYNPELAPWSILFQQGELYESLPPDQLAPVLHHLQEIKVVLIKSMISDQLSFVRVAKEYLTIKDLRWIRAQRIGRGKIGGKAAGMVLGWKILQQYAERVQGQKSQMSIVIPTSYFIGADVFYEFLEINDLSNFMNQKYKSADQIEEGYPLLRQAYLQGKFPEYLIEGLQNLLTAAEGQPLIVRSSSLLEDNFEASFAGKYESVFCPNQGTPAENLADLTQAIARVYASVGNPDAIMYRKQMGLLDFDERMAALIQVVQGQRFGDHLFPAVAGVAYSRNPFVWNPKLRREDGFARIVIGLGTRAVERVGEDYPRMIALSHPQLRPETGAQQIRYYSQYYMDTLDLEENKLVTHRVSDIITGNYPNLRYLASVLNDDYISPIITTGPGVDPSSLVMTFDGLLSQTDFAEQIRTTLKALEFGYGRPVDIEFTVSFSEDGQRPKVTLHLLQCRTQMGNELSEDVRIPEEMPERDIIFGTVKVVPTGRVRNVAYIVYVDPDKYFRSAAPEVRLELARLIGRINRRLDGMSFILLGPGRWGSSNPELGLKVGYADIYNTRALVEIGWATGGNRPTLSYGTHFFQDLVESRIFPLAIYPGEPGNPFAQEFFDRAINALPALLPDDAALADYVKVIDVPAITGGRVLELTMSGDEGRALAYLARPV